MDQEQMLESENRASHLANFWLISLVIVLLAATAASFAYGHRQNQTVSQLVGDNERMSATVSEMSAQLDSLNQKLIALAPPPALPSEQPAAATAGSGKRAAATERRLKQMQSQLAAQEEELKRTQNDVAETRTDLVGNLDSTRTELNGSIARTHEELVALARQGERDYFEFDLSKTKRFQRTGPISISLRKTDMKHHTFDALLIVDDNRLAKNHVNLYEPIWIHRADDPQPVQIVVMKIDKDHVHGYVGAPKYKRSELASNLAPSAPTISPTPDNSANPAPSANNPADSQETQQMPK
jgi:hypothetical protein